MHSTDRASIQMSKSSTVLATAPLLRRAVEPPMKSPFQAHLERLHARYAGLRTGEVATYIPELAKADPRWFSICIATIDGHVYEVGDSRQPFTMQSISKPFTYGLALEDRGADEVLRRIGVEPSGGAFNSISLAPATGCPLNPMINAGAIAAASLIAGRSRQDMLDRLLAVFSLYAGRPLRIDPATFESEHQTGHRNRAISHMLRNFDIVDDPEAALDLYFRQCSIEVNCRDLALMAATLANGGVHPRTGERAVVPQYVDPMLSVMNSCGLYDYSGEWAYRVGMPAKSGVSGGMLMVLPGQLGIGVFSPPVDARGNSVRAIEVCKDLARDLVPHGLRGARSSPPALRAQYDLAAVRSLRLRSQAQRDILYREGPRVRIYELQGELSFTAIEPVVRAIVDHGAGLDVVVLSLLQVTHVADPGARILLDLIKALHQRGQRLAFASSGKQSGLLRFLDEQLTADTRIPRFADLDAAVEWGENRLLGAAPAAAAEAPCRNLAEHDLCLGLDADAITRIEALLEPRRYAANTSIIKSGDPAREVYLLMSGEVSVLQAIHGAPPRRLSTLSAGMSFGDLANIDRSSCTAHVRADTAVECRVLSATAFERLSDTDPRMKIMLLQNMLRGEHRIVGWLNQEVAALSG
jgi:glutaminase